MAIRPVFSTDDKAPFYKTTNVEFVWNRDLSKSQKQKNISAIHKVFRDANPNKKVLEISSKSMQEGGEMLSAFFIKKYVSSLDHTVPVECIYQAGKVFEDGGPYLDLLGKSPKEAKKDKRLKTSGRLTGFKFAGKDFPICPKTFFYDYIYMNALLENPKLADILLQYDVSDEQSHVQLI